MNGFFYVIVAPIVATLFFLAVTEPPPYDDTDKPPTRSQMGLHTDHETGCQYLSVKGGGITPRLSATGQHMGCKLESLK